MALDLKFTSMGRSEAYLRPEAHRPSNLLDPSAVLFNDPDDTSGVFQRRRSKALRNDRTASKSRFGNGELFGHLDHFDTRMPLALASVYRRLKYAADRTIVVSQMEERQ